MVTVFMFLVLYGTAVTSRTASQSWGPLKAVKAHRLVSQLRDLWPPRLQLEVDRKGKFKVQNSPGSPHIYELPIRFRIPKEIPVASMLGQHWAQVKYLITLAPKTDEWDSLRMDPTLLQAADTPAPTSPQQWAQGYFGPPHLSASWAKQPQQNRPDRLSKTKAKLRARAKRARRAGPKQADSLVVYREDGAVFVAARAMNLAAKGYFYVGDIDDILFTWRLSGFERAGRTRFEGGHFTQGWFRKTIYNNERVILRLMRHHRHVLLAALLSAIFTKTAATALITILGRTFFETIVCIILLRVVVMVWALCSPPGGRVRGDGNLDEEERDRRHLRAREIWARRRLSLGWVGVLWVNINTMFFFFWFHEFLAGLTGTDLSLEGDILSHFVYTMFAIFALRMLWNASKQEQSSAAAAGGPERAPHLAPAAAAGAPAPAPVAVPAPAPDRAPGARGASPDAHVQRNEAGARVQVRHTQRVEVQSTQAANMEAPRASATTQAAAAPLGPTDNTWPHLYSGMHMPPQYALVVQDQLLHQQHCEHLDYYHRWLHYSTQHMWSVYNEIHQHQNMLYHSSAFGATRSHSASVQANY